MEPISAGSKPGLQPPGFSGLLAVKPGHGLSFSLLAFVFPLSFSGQHFQWERLTGGGLLPPGGGQLREGRGLYRPEVHTGSWCAPPQVCDSDTVLDPACTIEMLRVLEEDPQVGGVGGDVQVRSNQGSLG